MPKGRVMEVQSHTHDLYGNPIFTPDIINAFIKVNAVENGGALVRWCWTLQDKDVYTQEEQDSSADANGGTPVVMAGQKKPDHIHLAFEWKNQVHFSAVAKCFNLPERQVQKAKAKYNQFLHMCRYQTHEMPEEQAKGKHRYDDSEVHCNFDFRGEIDKLTKSENKAKARKMSKAMFAELIEKVEAGEITPEEIRKQYGYAFYQEKQKQIELARQEYITRYYTPSLRINFYVDAAGSTHGGRIGKTQLCKMLARSLFPDLVDSECFYEVGSARSGLQKYKEQPVIIWNDMRAVDMIQTFGRSELLNMLDDHPGKTESRILYGTVVPVQKFNIINGIEPYDEFLKGLAGTYTDRFGNKVEAEDESQVYGRFPFIIHVSQSWIDFMISRGWMNGTREYLEYDRFARCVGGIRRLMKGYEGEALQALGHETSKAVVEKVRYLESADTGKVSDVEQISDEDIPLNLTAQQADELERRLYNAYLQNQIARGHTSNNMGFSDWLEDGGTSSGIWEGTKKNGRVRDFTVAEIKEFAMRIVSENSEN